MDLHAQNIEFLSPEQVTPNARNPRTHSKKQINQIAAAIKEWGFTTALLIDENKTIIAGHGRHEAALQLGLDQVPCIKAEGWSDAKKMAYLLADNKLALNSEWDDELLRLELTGLHTEGFDIALIGFDDFNFEALDDESSETLVEPDVPIVTEPVTKPGDVWVLGNHRLMCGNATSFDDAAKLVNENEMDLWITDPPYNVDYVGKTKDSLKIQNDKMSNDNFRQFLTDCYSVADSVLKKGGVFYIWHAGLEACSFMGACNNVLWKVRQCLVWVKGTLVMGRQDYHWKHEPCLYGWKDGAAHFWGSDRKQATVLEFDRPSRNADHPTMKPIELFEYQIKNSTEPKGLVLDSFCGSGTTVLACERLGRKAFALEIDPVYCDVTIKRWQEMTGKDAVLESTGERYSDLKKD